MNGPGHELFARAAFAGDEHARIRARRAQHALAKLHHRRAVAHQLVEVTGLVLSSRASSSARSKRNAFSSMTSKPVGRQRLLQKVERAESCRAHRSVDCRVPAHHDDRDVVAALAELREEIDAIAVGQSYVEQHHVVGFLCESLLGQADPPATSTA